MPICGDGRLKQDTPEAPGQAIHGKRDQQIRQTLSQTRGKVKINIGSVSLYLPWLANTHIHKMHAHTNPLNF